MHTNDSDKTNGIYRKFKVERTDGSSAPGGKHENCRYFVLDLNHDPHAPSAISAYADSCRENFPDLAADLDAMFLNAKTIKPLACHLRDLLLQWRETAMLYATAPELRETANGYRECIMELEEILSGNLSAIEPL